MDMDSSVYTMAENEQDMRKMNTPKQLDKPVRAIISLSRDCDSVFHVLLP